MKAMGIPDRNRQIHARPLIRRLSLPWAILTIGMLAFIMIATMQQSAGQDSKLALIYLLEASRQFRSNHLEMGMNLLKMAGRLLGLRHGRLSPALVSNWETAAIQRLDGNAATPSSALVVVVICILALVTLYWAKERRIARLVEEQRLLRDKLLTITNGWMLATVKPGTVKEVIANILRQVVQNTVIDSMEVFAREDDRSKLEFSSLCRSGASLLRRHTPIPHALVTYPASAFGRVVRTREPWFSGVDGDGETILPGVHIEGAALYPLDYQDTVWGVLVLRASEPDWHGTLQDLLTILAKEIAVLLAYAKLEAEAVEAEKYQELARLRSELLANVSHDLRTPLGLIKGYAETVLHRSDRLTIEQQRDYVQIIVDETTQLENQIINLLRMATIETGGVEWKRSPFTLSDWIARVRRRLRPENRFHIHVDPPIATVAKPAEVASGAVAAADTVIHGDQDQLTDAVTNLTDNAVKYSDGMIDVSIAVDRGRLSVSVSDRGTGVPDDDFARIFERFYRSPQHAKSSKRGSGLGLSIAKRIIEAHDGRIWAENRADGFTVRFEIPLSKKRLGV